MGKLTFDIKYYVENNTLTYESLVKSKQITFKTAFTSQKDAENTMKELNKTLRIYEKSERDVKYAELIKQYEQGTLKLKPKKEKSSTPYIMCEDWDENNKTLYYKVTTPMSFN